MNPATTANDDAAPKSTTGQRLMPRTGPNGVGEFLRAHGFPLSDHYLNNICAPLVNEGPKPVTFWNRRPLYDETVLEWARAKAQRHFEAAEARANRHRAMRDAALERRAQRATA